MKKFNGFHLFLFVFLLVSFLTACGTASANDNADTLSGFHFTKITNVLSGSTGNYGYGSIFVDDITHIVYLGDASYHREAFPTTPYLAPNGQPYFYDEEQQTLIPIKAYPEEIIPEEWNIQIVPEQ